MIRRNALLFVGLVVLAPGLTSCSRLLGALEEEFEQKVVDEEFRRARGGCEAENEEDPPVEATIEINSIQPARGETPGGDPIEIVGFGFQEGMQVFFGPYQADPAFVDIEDTSIHCLTPAAAEPDVVTVRVVGPEETALLENGFEYYDPVTIEFVEPDRGPSEGGTELLVEGTGFIDGTVVTFGSFASVAASVIDLTSLRVRTPPLPADLYAITVENLNGNFTLSNAFRVFDPLDLESVTPFAGPVAGGTALTISGAGFIPETVLTLDGNGAPISANGAGSIATMAAPPGAEGPVVVAATNEFGQDIFNGGFAYYDPTDPNPRIIHVLPASTLVEGGGPIHLVVGGMPDTSTQVFFDGVLNPDCTAHDAFTLTCTAPPHAEGTVDIRVLNGASDVTRVDALQYIDLNITSVFRDEGAIAGNTYVQVLGSGFGPDSRVLFNGRPAPDLNFVGGAELNLYTPRGDAGPAEVTIETRGVSKTFNGLFTYFNPTHADKWTSGGPVQRSVNVTVINDEGVPVENAFVAVGELVNQGDHLSGFTDNRGQVTLSGPGLAGKISVHAAHTDYGNWSWVDVQARNITAMLSTFPEPPPDPLPECPEGDGGGPPIIRGTVSRVKDQFNTGNDVVFVTTTFQGLSSPLPDPGPGAQMISQGDYEIFTRTGDMTLIAMAGTITADNTLDVHAMGFHPFFFAEASSAEECVPEDVECIPEGLLECGEVSELPTCVPEGQLRCENQAEQCLNFDGQGFCMRIYEDIDIVIDTPLDQPMTVRYDNPPVGISPAVFDAAPNTAATSVWYDFGHMGVFPMNNFPLPPYLFGLNPPGPIAGPASDPEGTVAHLDMPRALPDELSTITFNVHGQVVGQGFSGDQAWSETFNYGLDNTREPVVLTPFLGALQELKPQIFSQASANPVEFEWRLLPEDFSGPEPTGMITYMYEVKQQPVCIGPLGPVVVPMVFIYWAGVVDGQTTEFAFPRLPATITQANMPAFTQVNWQTQALYSPDAEFNNMSLNELYDWDASSGRLSAFFTP